MEESWGKLKNLKEKVLSHLVTSHLSLSDANDTLHLMCDGTCGLLWFNRNPDEPLGDPLTSGYLQLNWGENKVGEDNILINEPETSNPYVRIDPNKEGVNRYTIQGSCYDVSYSTIKDIQGFGYSNDQGETFLHRILIEIERPFSTQVEKRFIHIESHPCLIINVTHNRPSIPGKQLF